MAAFFFHGFRSSKGFSCWFGQRPQISSARDSDCTLRVGSTSTATGVTCGDIVPGVEAGVVATRGDPGTHVCQHCGRHFRRGAVLKSHLPNCPHRPDVRTSSLSCQFCQRLFNRPCEVSKHQLSCPSHQASAADSEQAEKELACRLCDRRFKRPWGAWSSLAVLQNLPQQRYGRAV